MMLAAAGPRAREVSPNRRGARSQRGALSIRFRSLAALPAVRMRGPLLVLAVLLLTTASLAGCFERRGTLNVDLVVDDGGAIGEFRSLNLSLKNVQIKARTLNPEDTPSLVEQFELVESAQNGERHRVFTGSVRSDRYDKITLSIPAGATFRGALTDGTQVAAIVPGDALSIQTDFELGRGATLTYAFTIQVQKSLGTGDVPTYRVVAVPELSGPS
jgi:hypothetical protein